MLVLGCYTQSALPAERIWTSQDGKKIRAKYLTYKENKVQILTTEGKEFAVPLERFSAADQRFVKQLAPFARTQPVPDIVITNQGAKYFGVVETQGERVTIKKEDGTQLRLPARSVRTIHRGAQLLVQFQAALGSADLLDDTNLAKLTNGAREVGLDLERQGLLLHAYLLRREQADASADQLTALQELAGWCEQHELPQQGLRCQEDAMRLEFPRRQKAVSGNAAGLARLSAEYRQSGLVAEAEAAAEQSAPPCTR